ncbi:dipeptidyl-peptidase IV [Clostridium butyricum]|uniref:dipeptidyl-peptidase IV n=1 Tax=Clostridium butyricum TaxID=1492 RepID=UPI003D0C2314
MKKILLMFTIPLIFEICILYILNNFIFAGSSEFKSVKIECNSDTVNEFHLQIPTMSEKVLVSYNSKYLVYTDNDNIYLGNINKNVTNKINANNDESILFYNWLDNRDILVIVEKVNKGGKEKLQLVTYNAENLQSKNVQTICNYKNGMEIKQITESILTGVYYINISINKENIIYRIDRNDKLTKVDIETNDIKSIEELQHMDRLVYQDSDTGNILLTNPSEKLKITSKNNVLLGVDKNDNVYVGILNNERIESIIYGTTDTNTNNWTKVDIGNDLDSTNIKISRDGNVFIPIIGGHEVKNIINDKTYSYDGKLIQIHDNSIISIDEKGMILLNNI